jgi:hypothetical protein
MQAPQCKWLLLWTVQDLSFELSKTFPNLQKITKIGISVFAGLKKCFLKIFAKIDANNQK